MYPMAFFSLFCFVSAAFRQPPKQMGMGNIYLSSHRPSQALYRGATRHTGTEYTQQFNALLHTNVEVFQENGDTLGNSFSRYIMHTNSLGWQ
jgi:hypothetical protein